MHMRTFIAGIAAAATVGLAGAAAQAEWKQQELKFKPPVYLVMSESAPLKTLTFQCGPKQELHAALLAMGLDVEAEADVPGTIETETGSAKLVWKSTKQTSGLVPVQMTGAAAATLMDRVAAAKKMSFTVQQKSGTVETWSFTADAAPRIAWLKQKCNLK